MASYSNLTSLEGLVAGDIVRYTAITTVETKGYKFKAELYGGGYNASYRGGYTYATIDSKNIPQITVMFSRDGTGSDANIPYPSSCLCYGSFSDYASCLYYRFLVAGAGGKRGNGSPSAGIKGGGTNTYAAGSYYYAGTGTQTAGGAKGKSGGGSNVAGKDGTFGYGGTITASTYYLYGAGGDGWYGGGSSSYNTISSSLSSAIYGGGGSGFIIGQTTTTYPAGYLGDNTELQTTLASAISDAQTQTGTGAYGYYVRNNPETFVGGPNPYYTEVILTIIEEGSSIITVDVSEAQDGSVIMELTPTEANPSVYDAVVKQAEGSTNTVWYQNIDTYEGTIKTLTIPDGITQIPSGLFHNDHGEEETEFILESINFGSTLQSIPNNCFNRCNHLTAIEIPGNIKSIGSNSLAYCTNISNIILNEGLLYIGNNALTNSAKLDIITLPASLTTIDVYGSFNTKNISVASGSIDFKSVDGVLYSYDGKTIVMYPKGRDNVEEFTVLNGVEIIGKYFGNDISNIAHINIPSTIKEIKEFGLYHYGFKNGILTRSAYIDMTEKKFYSSVIIDEYGIQGDMVLSFKAPALPRLQYYKDTKFRDSTTYYYDGSKFVKVEPYIYNNGNFDPQ